LDYYRARYYAPSPERFIAQDPADFRGSGADLYAYAGGDPIDYNDPSGLERPGLPIPAPRWPGLPWPTPHRPWDPKPNCRPKKDPLGCGPLAGAGLALGNGLAFHVAADYIVDAAIGVTVGPEVLITALALDMAFGVPIDLLHDAACGDSGF
jgi:hypothetical protein